MNKFSWQKLCFLLFGAQCTPLSMDKTKITCSFLSRWSGYRWRHVFTGKKCKARYLQGHWRRLDQKWTNTPCAGSRSRCSVPNGSSEIQTWVPGNARLGRKSGRAFPCAGNSAVPLWKAGMVYWHVLPIAAWCDPYTSRMKQKRGRRQR